MKSFAIATMLAAAGTASADLIIEFTANSLVGNYDHSTGQFLSEASVASSLTVTRTVVPTDTAEFDAGFWSPTSTADMEVDLTVSNNNGLTADGDGSFTITDEDGDLITGKINGQFINGAGPTIFFNGYLSDVYVVDVSGDGTIDGPTSGGISTDFFWYASPFAGSFVELAFVPADGFFDEDFSSASVLATGNITADFFIIPGPGSMAIAGLGGLVATRRRR